MLNREPHAHAQLGAAHRAADAGAGKQLEHGDIQKALKALLPFSRVWVKCIKLTGLRSLPNGYRPPGGRNLESFAWPIHSTGCNTFVPPRRAS